MVSFLLFLHMRGKYDYAPPWIILFNLTASVRVMHSEGTQRLGGQTHKHFQRV